MKKLFGKIKGAVEDKLQGALIAQIFQPIEESDSKLYKSIKEFCESGVGPECLLTTAPQSLDFNAKLNFSASSRWMTSMGREKCAVARTKLYDMAESGLAPYEQVVRLGKILSTFANDSFKHTDDSVPEWLHVLLVDMTYEQARVGMRTSEARPVRGIPFYEALCEAGDLAQESWLFFYFDRQQVGSYWGFRHCLSMFNSADGFSNYIKAKADVIIEKLFPKLAVDGKVFFLEEIERLDLKVEFEELILALCVEKSKKVSAKAHTLVLGLHQDKVKERLGRFLIEGSSDERKLAAPLIGRLLGESGSTLLESALEQEKLESVKTAIKMALNTSSVSEKADDIELPAYAKPIMDTQAPSEVVDILYSKIKDLQEAQKGDNPTSRWEIEHKKRVMALGKMDAERILNMLNGKEKPSDRWHQYSLFTRGLDWLKLPGLELKHVIRLHSNPNKNDANPTYIFNNGPLADYIKANPEKLSDLRQLCDVIVSEGWSSDLITREILQSNWWRSFLFDSVPASGVWPFFASRLDVLNSALMSQGSSDDRYRGISLDRVIDVLETFNDLPVPVRPALLQIALGEGKTYRDRAQSLLGNVANIEKNVISALESSTQESRINAARWLMKLANPNAIEPIKKALKKEKRDPARATMISALESLGEDISELISPKVLLGEAEKGLKKQIPKSLSWFPMEQLPDLKWADGAKVEPSIVKWWVVLACKLKEPGGNELLHQYLGRLDENSREQLGLFVLNCFIRQDTLNPSYEEAEAQAKAGAQGRYSSWQQWAKYEWGKAYANYTLEDAHIAIRNEVLGTYLGSAIKDKGILALTTFTNGAEAVALMQRYMKDHYTRRAQIESMLKGLAPGNDGNVIQLLLSVSRRYRTKSVQELARALVEEIAVRNGWTRDELADRTMPSAGFDKDGQMILDYGSRQVKVLLDSQLKPVIVNEAGKAIKSLPAPRQSDNEELVKEAKALFSASKKELKQIVPLTSGRFYESMCSQRQWDAKDWFEYIYEHPLANRIAQRLVWLYSDGDRYHYFRPTEDGALIDQDDDEFELPTTGYVSLPHCSNMDKEFIQSWQSHLKDYAVKPLFEQLDRPSFDKIEDKKQIKLNTFEGYVSDSFTLRGVFTKLGYQRGQAEDGGFFYLYYKDFSSLDLKAIILFSGNCLPEENVPVALQDLCFSRLSMGGWFTDSCLIPLSDVPPILLSEVMADYKSIADKTGGFDPDWQKKMPW